MKTIAYGFIAIIVCMIIVATCASCGGYYYTVRNIDTNITIEGKSKYSFTVGDTVTVEPYCERMVILYKE